MDPETPFDIHIEISPYPPPIKENVFGGVPAINCITMFFFQEYSIFQPVILAQLKLIMRQSRMV